MVSEEYKERHDSVAKVAHAAIAREWKLLEDGPPYCEYKPAKVTQNEHVEVLWDRTIHTYKTLPHNRPDIIVKNKKERGRRE